jgi:short-subunit dehydrogenase
MQNFQGKVVWITGASSGIGAELAKQCAENGAIVVLSGRNQKSLEHVKENLLHPDAHLIVPLDLEHSENFKELAALVISQLNRIDILINNGGISQRGTAYETDESVDRRIMEVNYFGNIALAKAALPYMRKQGDGHIVVLSSIAGKFGFFLRSAYSASKHALHGFYESLMLEEEGNGIKITIACPGKINTNISVNALNSSGESHGVMDHNQETGMTAAECARIMLHAVSKGKKEVLIGKKEIKAVTLKRFLPGLFWKIIRKQSAT